MTSLLIAYLMGMITGFGLPGALDRMRVWRRRRLLEKLNSIAKPMGIELSEYEIFDSKESISDIVARKLIRKYDNQNERV